MMNLNQKYDRAAFLDFLQNTFFSDYAKDVRPVGTEGLNVINKATSLGRSNSLDLQVFEFEYTGSANKRVTLTKEAFQIMKQSATFNALAVFYGQDSDDWRLSFLTANPQKTEKGKVTIAYSNPRRYSFFLGPNAKINTPTKFLISRGRIASFDDLKSRFSIEVVNKEFYKEISKAFRELSNGLLKLPFVQEKNQTNLEFAVRLIGRIIFCWFLREKKSDSGLALMPKELLSLEAVMSNEDYYHKILEPIFFEVLNKPVKLRKDEFSKDPFSSVPYLNGGLFSPQDDDYYKRNNADFQSQFHNTLVVPDNWFMDFFETLETYNFTIDENTSFDEELSIDPEMLGRIFENLLAEINPETGESARKATGSYYTPRTIVSYMVDESLFLYLKQKTNIDEDKLRAIISYDLTDDSKYPISQEEKEKIIDALENLKLLDPACGSGAFPIGALQKIVFILQQIDPDGQLWFRKQLLRTSPELRRVIEREFEHQNFDYIRKLGIIRENIYGIDIQPIATEISRLRCFLTLIVDERVQDELENRGIEPLPNLDFKFVTANSLIGLPTSRNINQMGLFEDNQGIRELKELRDMFFTATGVEREQLKLQFVQAQNRMFQRMIDEGRKGYADLTTKLSGWDPFSHKASTWFDPEWMFGIKEGFDIVIANPPYISHYSKQSQRLEKINEDYLRKNYEFLFKESKKLRINSSMFFLEKGYKLLALHGLLNYIIDLNVLENPFKSVRKYLTERTDLLEIVTGLTVFESAASGQILLFLQNDHSAFNEVKIKFGLSGDSQKFSQRDIVNNNFSWTLCQNSSLLHKIELNSIDLSNLVEIHTGVAVYATEDGRKTFLKDKKETNCHPLLVGGKSVKFSYCKCLPAGYLLYDKLLEKKFNDEFDRKYVEAGGSHQRPFNLRKISEYDRPKIILRQSDSKLTATYSDDLVFGNYSLFNIYSASNDKSLLKYILALLNSRLLSYYAKEKEIILVKPGKTPQIRSGQRGPTGIRQLPIKKVPEKHQTIFGQFVDKIFAITNSSDYLTNLEKQAKVRDYEKQIDQMVYKLYGLTKEEIRIVEGKND